MSTQPSLFDICANKHGDNPESVSANQQIASHKRNLQAKVYELILSRGSAGVTSHEICALLGMKLQTVSARCAELKAQHVIQSNGERRNGAAVLVSRYARNA